MKAILSILFILSFTAVGRAQEVCKALLSGGVFDQTMRSSDKFALAYYRAKMCSASNSSTSLGLGYEGFELSLTDTQKKAMCSDNAAGSEQWESALNWSKTASQPLLTAFNTCVASEGIHIWTERSTVNNSFVIKAIANYSVKSTPDAHFQLGFTPENAVGDCNPLTKTQLKAKIKIGNYSAFHEVCALNSTEGVEVSLISSDARIGTSGLSVAPYNPLPVFIRGDSPMIDSDAVKLPTPLDATWNWGSDTLLNQYSGNAKISPISGTRFGAWKVDHIMPGRYNVFITYAANESRPLDLFVNDQLALPAIAGQPTGGWTPASRQKIKAGQISLSTDAAVIKLQTSKPEADWPHFKELELVYADK